MNFFVGGVWSNMPPFSLFTNPSSPLSFCVIELSQHRYTWWVLPAGITCWPLVSGIHRVPGVTRNKLLSKQTSRRWFKPARRLCSLMVMQTLVYLTRKLQCLQSLKVIFMQIIVVEHLESFSHIKHIRRLCSRSFLWHCDCTELDCAKILELYGTLFVQ